MEIKVEDIVEKCGMDYRAAGNLDIGGVTEISFEDATCLPGRGVCLDKEQDIYTNDLVQEERRSNLLRIFRMLEK